MIKSYEKFVMADQNKEKDFFIEVNWDKKNPDLKDCKLLKVTFPNGESAIIKKESLNAVLFIIGNPEEQRKMIPQSIRKSRWYETVVTVEAKKAIRKGESITFPIKLTLPDIEEEVISEIRKENVKKQ